MTNSEQPPWRKDVHRALEAAFTEYSAALDGLEVILSNDNTGVDLLAAEPSTAAHARRIDSARARLHRALKLAVSRDADAGDSLDHPSFAEMFAASIDAHHRRGAVLAELLRRRMGHIAEEIRLRTGRRPKRPVFRETLPAHIDLRL